MTEFLRNHYGKLLAFLAGWASEALVAISDHLVAILRAIAG